MIEAKGLYDFAEDLRAHAAIATGPLHVRAFCAWLLNDTATLAVLVEAATATGQQRHPEHVAVLGYAAASSQLSDGTTVLLREDVAQLAGRSYFASGRPLRFEIDGIALLGVALGLSRLSPAGNFYWLLNVLDRSPSVLDDEWNRGLAETAKVVLGRMNAVIGPTDLCIAMASKGIGQMPTNLDAAWALATGLTRPETPDRAAGRLVALQELTRRAAQIVPRTATREDLVAILEGTHRSLKRWPYGEKTPRSMPALWEIANEYNVQDLLWAVLAPLFPDLEDEEGLPSLGPKHPRADLGIPRLRTIVEVKFLRRDRQADRAQLIEEVAADASLYLSKTTEYDGIVAYVWDDAAQTDQHHEIKMGLEAISGIMAAVIVPRPAKMARATLIDQSRATAKLG
jgi:hypothetical protein